MARVCGNGREVREGMFVCPACGSDDVRERDAEPLPVSVDVVGQAVPRLNSLLIGGILLYLAGP